MTEAAGEGAERLQAPWGGHVPRIGVSQPVSCPRFGLMPRVVSRWGCGLVSET